MKLIIDEKETPSLCVFHQKKKLAWIFYIAGIHVLHSRNCLYYAITTALYYIKTSSVVEQG